MTTNRRKQRQTNASARAARRRAKITAKAPALQLDPALPTTIAEIEAAQEAALLELAHDPSSSRIEHEDGSATVHMGPAAAKAMKLQLQLFRVVFGREPGKKDPLFWDRSREHEGVFPIDDAEYNRELRQAASTVGIRPELSYAMALTGLIVTEQNLSALSANDLAEWEEAVEDYKHQAATGAPPLTPDEFTEAWAAIDRVALTTRPTALNTDRGAAKLLAAARTALGTEEKARAALTRLTALIALGESGEIADLVSPEGFLEIAVVAAASAEVDRSTGLFILASFRERVARLDEEGATE
jgi:hypothetical protein